MTDSSEKDGRSDWSASFVRVRTEMSVTAVILVSVVWLDMSLTKIPGFGIDLSHPAPKGWIMLFLLLFFIYFATSLVLKYWRESAHIREPRKFLLLYEDTLRREVDRLMSFSQPDHAAELKQYTDSIGKAYEVYQQVSVERFERLWKWKKERQNSTENSFVSFQRDANNIISTEGPLDADKVQELHRGYAYIMGENARRSDLNYDKNLNDLEKHGADFLARVNETMSAALAAMEERANQMEGQLHAQGPDIDKALGEIIAKTDALRAKLRSLASANFWDNLAAGFWIPLAFSCVSVLISLPRAFAEIDPVITSAIACLSADFMACAAP